MATIRVSAGVPCSLIALNKTRLQGFAKRLDHLRVPSVPPRASSIAGKLCVFGHHRSKQPLAQRVLFQCPATDKDEFLARPRSRQHEARAPPGSCPSRFPHQSARDHPPGPDPEYPREDVPSPETRQSAFSSSWLPSDNSRRNARLSMTRRRALVAFLASSLIRSGLNGFSRKSNAPTRIASTAIGTSP